eukprot:Awhi_evm1s8061
MPPDSKLEKSSMTSNPKEENVEIELESKLEKGNMESKTKEENMEIDKDIDSLGEKKKDVNVENLHEFYRNYDFTLTNARVNTFVESGYGMTALKQCLYYEELAQTGTLVMSYGASDCLFKIDGSADYTNSLHTWTLSKFGSNDDDDNNK